MHESTAFDEALTAVEHLPVEQQADLVELVRRRLAERGRQQVVEDVREARAEHAAGKSRVLPVDEIMREIES